MSRVRSVPSDDGLHVIVCLTFDHRAPPDEVSAFRRCVVECPDVLETVEMTGRFDLMVEASVKDVSDFNEKLERLGEPLARLVAHYETSFVCKRYVRTDQPDDFIWVQNGEGAQRIDFSLINRVTAEGDYMRLHSADQSWLVHSTLKTLLERFDPEEFVQVHRSVVLRCDFIERLIHRGKRWSARLVDGTSQHIAKSHVAEVLDALGIGSSKQKPGSTNSVLVNEKLTLVAE